MNDNDIVKEFLVEIHENLDRLDRDLVDLEKNPKDKEALAGVFRTIHTIKGTCGFLAFNRLEKVAHVGENLLTRLRDGLLILNPEITTALLGMVDAVRQMLKEIELTGQDGAVDYPELRETLTQLLGVEPAAATLNVVEESPEREAVPPPAPKKVKATAAKKKVQAAVVGSAIEPAAIGTDELAKPEDSSFVQQGSDSRNRETAADTIRVG